MATATPTISNEIAKTNATIEQTTETGVTVQVTGTYNRNYGFYNAVVSYLSTDGTVKTANVHYSFNSYNREVLTANIEDCDFSQPVTVSGQYVAGVCRVNNANLTNCVATGLKDRYLKNEDINVVLTAETGYKFDVSKCPVLEYTDGYGYYLTQQYDSVVSEDGKTATFNFNLSVLYDQSYSCDYSQGIEFVGSAIADVVLPIIQFEITGRETVNNYTFGEDGVNLSVEVKTGAPTKVNFTETPVATYTDVNGVEKSVTFTVDNTGYKAKATALITDANPNTTIIITGEVLPIIYVYEAFENCSVDGLKQFYKLSDTVNITLTANEKCLFEPENKPYASWQNDDGFYVSEDFEISADRKTATFVKNLSTSDISGALSFGGGAVPNTGGYEKNYGAINAYIVTPEDLDQFSQKRFATYNDDGTATLIDLGKYINRIRRVFVDVEDRVSNVIKLGNYNLDIDCFSPTTDRKTYDFGTVTVPTHNNDVTDLQSEITLFLPFVGFQSIDNSLVGKELNLQYEINLLTGDGAVKLFVDGLLFDVFNCKPSAEVIYRLSDFTQIGGDEYNPQILYGLQPFVKFKWFTSENNNLYNADNSRVIIGNVTGYARFSEITDITADIMTGEEKKLIYNLLNSGVYVDKQTAEN